MNKVMFKNLMIIVAIFGLVLLSCEEEELTLSLNETKNVIAEDISLEISQNELDGLLYMREEEKLAHDVYVYLYNLWNLPVFNNISKSETVHTNKVLELIDSFGLEDSALPNEGEYNNPELQALHNKLVEQGSDSLVAALLVGTTIEEVDIIDLKEEMEVATENSILTVYGSLMKGSEAHLRAFVAQLSLQGYKYEPQFLSQEEYDAIINND